MGGVRGAGDVMRDARNAREKWRAWMGGGGVGVQVCSTGTKEF